MKRVLFEIAFNGENYHGWQIQDNATSIQEHITKSINIIIKSENVINIIGCGRTDKGVHAEKFYFHVIQYKDFTSFSKVHTNVKNFNCNIIEAFWRQNGHQIIFTITSNRFLRNMVRAIVGTMLLVGQKKISLQDFCQIIELKDRSLAGPSVKAKGLFLVNVDY